MSKWIYKKAETVTDDSGNILMETDPNDPTAYIVRRENISRNVNIDSLAQQIGGAIETDESGNTIIRVNTPGYGIGDKIREIINNMTNTKNNGETENDMVSNFYRGWEDVGRGFDEALTVRDDSPHKSDLRFLPNNVKQILRTPGKKGNK